MRLTDEEIECGLEVCVRATPAPWKHGGGPGCRSIKGGKIGRHRQAQYKDVAYTVGLHDDEEDKANAVLIASAPTLLPAALAELKRWRPVIEAAKALKESRDHLHPRQMSARELALYEAICAALVAEQTALKTDDVDLAGKEGS